MTKSWVSMAQHQCLVCGDMYDTGEILMDKHLKPSMEKYTVTGHGFCPEHQKMKDDGYIALVEFNRDTNTHTGAIAHVKAESWPHIFNDSVPVPPKGIAHVEIGFIAVLMKKVNKHENT